MGGTSAERDVSLASGRECGRALREAGYSVQEIDPGPDLPAVLASMSPDVVFNALHGRGGEDGHVQGLLGFMGLPHTHSGVLGSALVMDKQHSKDLFRAAGLPVMNSVIAPARVVREKHVMKPPYVVKPIDEGSSVGIFLVRDPSDPPPRLQPEMPEKVMVEQFASGCELTTAVMGNTPLSLQNYNCSVTRRLK